MPELPEVETVRRQLEPVLVGRRIESVRIIDPLLVAPVNPTAVRRALVGRSVVELGRRGKYLQVVLDGGDTLVMHLRMTGRLHHTPAGGRAPADRHRRARFTFDDGATLDFSDTRRFGRAWVLPDDGNANAAYWAARLGPEPLDPGFTPQVLADALRGRSAPVKATLLDQRRVAGIGNIYADEALFQARVHPLRPAGDLTDQDVAALRDAIVDRLQVGIAQGGASIDRYRDTLGRPGSMQDMLRVHRHEGDPCPVCGTTIVKTRVAQRGTYHCPECQPVD
jgi:formamidopyrimidine-DNA glycosylase